MDICAIGSYRIRDMNKKPIGYWILTALFCLAMTASGSMHLLQPDELRETMAALGYPAYMMTILGIAKLSGVVALLLPRTPLLKEWAYAGFTILLLGAAASHASSGDPFATTIMPVIMLAMACGSYLLRPETRRLQQR